jgi:hypothetical protein
LLSVDEARGGIAFSKRSDGYSSRRYYTGKQVHTVELLEAEAVVARASGGRYPSFWEAPPRVCGERPRAIEGLGVRLNWIDPGQASETIWFSSNGERLESTERCLKLRQDADECFLKIGGMLSGRESEQPPGESLQSLSFSSQPVELDQPPKASGPYAREESGGLTDLGETWTKVAEAARRAEEAARTYQRVREDPSTAEETRLQARDDHAQTTDRLHDALWVARVQEQDGLWSEVQDAAQRAQAAGQRLFSQRHELSSLGSERLEAEEAYTLAKSQLVSLFVQLQVVPQPEPIAPIAEEEELEAAESREQVSKPTVSEEQHDPAEVAEAPR